MKMNDVREKAFLLELLPRLRKDPSFINDFGNDASVLDIGLPDVALAFKIDRAARPMAAYQGWAGFETWGRLAVTANLSDILAVGAVPKGFMLSVTVPGDWDVDRTKAIIFGAEEECERNGVAFLGGDTKEADEPHIVGAAVGLVDKKKILSRRSAKPGDVIVLAGQLGGFSAAYLLLRAGVIPLSQTNLSLVSNPRCALSEAQYLFGRTTISSAVDLSDGLWEGLQLLVGESEGIELELDSLPLHSLVSKAAKTLNVNFRNFAFTVGDWGMLFAIPEHEAKKVISEAPQDVNLAVIGRVTLNNGITIKSESLKRKYRLNCDLTNEHFGHRMETEGDYFTRFLSTDILVEET